MFTYIKANRHRRSFKVSVTAIVAVIAVIAYAVLKPDAAVEETAAVTPAVTVKSVGDIDFANTFEVVGTVQAISEARLQAEAAGRITAVNVEIGDKVGAGQVIATIENRTESASLLQAQGAYEAALAGAAASNVSVSQAESGLRAAENAAQNAVRGAYTTVSNAFYGTIDDFYANPKTSLPSVKIVTGQSSFLNQERLAFQDILANWQVDATELQQGDAVSQSLRESREYTVRTIAIVDAFARSLTERDTETFEGQPVATYIAELNVLRSNLNGTLAALDGAEEGVKAARETVKLAELGGTSGDVSAANAQVKIALGSLRAAQANYEKTIVRTPISGVVNALYLKAGDYAAPSQPAAIIANNNGLEISTAVSLEDSQTLAIGDAVTIDDTSTGVITAIGGAIDPTTGKVALKVSVDEGATLENGATVSLSFSEGKPETTVVQEIVIPLSALKMTGSGPVVFFVAPDNTLAANPVVLGAIRGDSVVIKEGLTLLDAIVMDARGLKPGQVVTVTTN